MTWLITTRLNYDVPLRTRRSATKREGATDIINLGAGDGLPPVDWAAVTDKLDAGSAPAPDAHNSRTSIRDADVVIEGDAARATDPGIVARIAAAWTDSGWPAVPDESGSGITAPSNAPSQGPPPWHVYRIEPRSATVALGTEPGGLLASDSDRRVVVVGHDIGEPLSNSHRGPEFARVRVSRPDISRRRVLNRRLQGIAQHRAIAVSDGRG